MRGQWITQYTGSNTGTVVIDLDGFQDRFEGTAIAWDDNPELPNSLVKSVPVQRRMPNTSKVCQCRQSTI